MLVPTRIVPLLIAATAIAAGLALSAAVAQDGSAFTEEEFRGWKVRCLKEDSGCTAFTQSQGAQLIVAMNEQADVPVRVALHVPPQAGKDQPIALYLDSEVSFQVRTWNCTQAYCEGQVAPQATNTVLTRLISDTKGMIIYRLEKDLHMVPIELAEFDKAWKAARK